MKEKKIFSKIGVIYGVFSIVVFALQSIAVVAADGLGFHSVSAQMTASSLVLYISGLLILGIWLQKSALEKLSPQKHSMKISEMFRAFCMCYSLMIASNMVGLMFTGLIGRLKGSPVVNPLESLVYDLDMPVLFVITVVCAPVFEELFFRKFLIDRTLPYGEAVSVLLSGFMFGLFHGNLSQFLYAFTLGSFFAYIYIRTGKIGYCMILHAIINSIGSIVSALVMNNINLDSLMSISLTGTEEQMMQDMLSVFRDPGFIMLMLYEMIILLIIVLGLLFWIFGARKIRFETTREELPKGKRVSVVFGNVGMILYCVVWCVMIVYATII